MIRNILKKKIGKLIAFIMLCFIGLSLSAFTVVKNTRYMTRFDTAQLLESIIFEVMAENKCGSLPGVEEKITYSDLNSIQQETIQNVLNYKLMSGYSDGSFRPDEPMRNLELVAYLQQTTVFLREFAPESEITKNLFRFLSYNEEPEYAFEYTAFNFPEGLKTPGRLTSKNLAAELAKRLISSSEEDFYVLNGRIVCANTGKAINTAFISANRKAVQADENGYFEIKLPKENPSAEIFAVADNYLPIELKKDLTLSTSVTLRLRAAD